MATETKTKKAAAPKAAKAPKVAKTAASKGETAPTLSGLQKRKILTGIVVSDKMSKTIVVKVDRPIRHALYKKYVTKSRKFKAHDENNTAKVGDLVALIESRPLSRDKRWALQKIIRKADQTAEANI
jgi:small subunit ribosomal protein S17